MSKSRPFIGFFGFFLLLFITGTGFSASLPQSTQKLLKQFNIDPSMLDDIEKELTVPRKWIKAKDEKWTQNYLTKLFTEVKPQLRKEGMNLLPQLVAAGEFLAAMPSNNKRPYQLKLDGAPVGFTCPEPVPVATEDAVVIRGGNVHTAKLFTNWLLSKEGQVAQYAFEYATPLNPQLRAKLLPFRDQILGRTVVFRTREFEMEMMPNLSKFWNDLWLRGGGAARRRR